jgi:precorrin-2/cobalt-factor-2 C20-methyltransferase
LRQKLSERGYETKSVAGVTAMCAVAAALDRDLTTRDEVLTIIPASVSKEDLDKYLDIPGNKVVMKAGKSLDEMLEELGKRDLLEKAAMGINCGLPGEQLYTSLKDVGDVEGYFATILI